MKIKMSDLIQPLNKKLIQISSIFNKITKIKVIPKIKIIKEVINYIVNKKNTNIIAILTYIEIEINSFKIFRNNMAAVKIT